MARSLPRDSATVIPVGASSRTATALTSTPSRPSWSSMNWPAGSAPTAATSVTRTPSRAAATAVMAADPPMTREMLGHQLLLLAERGRHVVAQDQHVRITVADHDQVRR